VAEKTERDPSTRSGSPRASSRGEKAQRIIADNRKAFHDYHVLESWEAGVALLGSEVKAIREGRVNLRDSYARIERGEIWLLNVHISPYSHTDYAGHAEKRERKLLLHRHELNKLALLA
jgi:SsrA-binding protein